MSLGFTYGQKKRLAIVQSPYKIMPSPYFAFIPLKVQQNKSSNFLLLCLSNTNSSLVCLVHKFAYNVNYDNPQRVLL